MTKTESPIVSIDYYGGHSEITYCWRGGLVHQVGPAGRTDERIAAIVERGNR